MKHVVWLYDICYLQLSEGIVTLFLPWSLLSAHGDELVDAVCNCPVDTKTRVVKDRLAVTKINKQKVRQMLFTEQQQPVGS